VASNFDPYHAWLGIPQGMRPLNLYQLLGLPPFVAEPPRIAEAAARQLNKVQSQAAGPQADAARRLIDELNQAKAVLLNAASRKKYDAMLRHQLGIPEPMAAPLSSGAAGALPPEVGAAMPAAAVPAAPTYGAPAMPAAMTPMQAAPMAAAPMTAPPVSAIPMPGAPMMAPMAAAMTPTAVTPGMPMAALPMGTAPMGAVPMAGMPTAVPALAPGQPIMGGQPIMAAQPVMPGQPMMVPQAMAVPMGGMAVGPTFRALSGRRRQASSTGIIIAAVVGLACSAAATFVFKDQIFAALGMDSGSATDNMAERKYLDAPKTQRAAASSRAVEPPADMNDNEPLPPRKVTPDKESRRPMETAMNNSMRTDEPSMPAKRPESPAKKSEQMPAKETPAMEKPAKVKAISIRPDATEEETSSITRALLACRSALAEHNLTKAEEQLDLALVEASSSQSVAAVERTRQLFDAVKQFWHAVDEGLKGLNATDEVVMGDTVGLVVERTDKKLVIRIEGKNREYTFDKLPTAVARGIAERWLSKDDPNTRMFLAAFMAVDPKGDMAKAKELLSLAAAAGADTGDLAAEFDAIKLKR
jgi:hypothetical protein